MKTFQTACHCQRITGSFNLPVATVVQCHCQNCRKLQGSDYSTWVVVPEDQHRLATGSELVSEYEFGESSAKGFCDACGTTVYGINGKHFKGQLVIPRGIILNSEELIEATSSQQSELNPKIQVYTEHKVEWHHLQETVPIYS